MEKKKVGGAKEFPWAYFKCSLIAITRFLPHDLIISKKASFSITIILGVRVSTLI
jgi:hypothetical protein